LHVKLIRVAATSGYARSAILATVPPIKEERWLKAAWLRRAIQDKLIEPIRKTPSVVPVRGEPLAPRNAVLLRADEKRQILELRHLLEGMEHTSTLLPSPEEAEPWSKAITSWMDSGEETRFREAWDGRKLAEEIAKKARHQTKTMAGWSTFELCLSTRIVLLSGSTIFAASCVAVASSKRSGHAVLSSTKLDTLISSEPIPRRRN